MKYGCLHPNPETVEYPVTASQYFRHDGPNFVYLDSNGRVSLALAATATIFGYAVIPKGGGAGTSPNDYWLSSATEGADKVPVIPATGNYSFLCLADATPTAAQAGDDCDLDAVNDGTAYYADIGETTTDVLIIQGRGVDFKADAGANDVVVKINPTLIQSD